jgi:hypothetical protein
MRPLPFVDEHVWPVAAPVEQTWTALRAYVDRLVAARHAVLSRVLGTVPVSGFAVAEERAPDEVTLAGRHRFSTYRLVFRVTSDGAGGSRLHALTYAAFPGLRGTAYRAALMASTGHARATRRMLRLVAEQAEG